METYTFTESDRQFMKRHDLTEEDLIAFMQDMERERQAEIEAVMKEEADRYTRLMNPEHD